MSTQKTAYDFFMNHDSTVEAVYYFIDQFLEIYESLSSKKQPLFLDSFHQMFRKYYYTALVPDTFLTPANIINTLVEREFGSNTMVLPLFKMDYQKDKLSDILLGVKAFEKDNHFFAKDMMMLIRLAEKGDGIEITEPSIISPEKYSSFWEDLTIPDLHYLSILYQATVEEGFIEEYSLEGVTMAKSTMSAQGYIFSSREDKLDWAISAVISLCSLRITEALPQFKNEFSEEKIRNLLTNPRDCIDILKPLLKGMNLNKTKLSAAVKNNIAPENFLPAYQNDKMGDIVLLNFLLDMYFYTPFGYYLQLIQPIYVSEQGDTFDIKAETKMLLDPPYNMPFDRTNLFSAAFSYDLTPLGEELLAGTKKPKRRYLLPADMDDEEILPLIQIRRIGIDVFNKSMSEGEIREKVTNAINSYKNKKAK